MSWWEELKERVKELATQIAALLIEAVFLCIWIILQYLVHHYIIEKFAPKPQHGLDFWRLIALQVIFALATLAPIAIYTYMDVRIIIIRAQRQIRRERQLNEPTDERNQHSESDEGSNRR